MLIPLNITSPVLVMISSIDVKTLVCNKKTFLKTFFHIYKKEKEGKGSESPQFIFLATPLTVQKLK